MATKVKGKYVDGFVVVVPKKNVAEYKKVARKAGKMWIKHGALEYKEYIGDDLKPDTSGQSMLFFQKMTKAKPNETIWFSYIVYKSKRHRDSVNKKVMADPAMQSDEASSMGDMPFDAKKMAWGGFRIEVDA